MRPFIQRGTVTFEVDLDNVKLRSLHVQMDRKCMEMRMPGCSLYAELLADSEFQKVGDTTR